MEVISVSKTCLEKILKPINRLTESCVLNITSSNLYSICSSPDNTVILYVKIPIKNQTKDEFNNLKLNLISIKKLLSGLECLGNDGVFSLKIEDNYIRCENVNEETDEKTYFKYHLVDNSVVKEAPVNINKISSLVFDTEFTISLAKIRQLIHGYAFASDITKLYFSSQDNKIVGEINDKTLQNIDNISITLSTEYKGESIDTPTPVSIEIFKNLAQCKSDVKVRINNQYKVFVFQNVEEEDIELKYIVSALVK